MADTVAGIIFNIYFSMSLSKCVMLKLGTQTLFEHTFSVSCEFWHFFCFFAFLLKMYRAMRGPDMRAQTFFTLVFSNPSKDGVF